MNVSLIVVERHGDGKLYPERWWDLPRAQVERVRGLEHLLRCDKGLSFRQVQRVLLEQFGERRSLGVIFKDIRRYECAHCIPEPTTPPRPRARPVPWR